MSKSPGSDNLAQDDDFLDDGNEWTDSASDNALATEEAKPPARSGPKWQAIEVYWERKRLRDALQDYLTEED
jgi:hypothetical protein